MNNNFVNKVVRKLIALNCYLMFCLVLPSYAAKSTSIAEKESQIINASLIGMPQSRDFSGTIQAHQWTDLSSQINARVADVLVDAGDIVSVGDILLRLESDDLSARVLQSQQQLASLQARVNEARLNYKRIKKLASKKLVSQSELDKARSSLNSLESSLKAQRAALTEAEVAKSYSVITAPFDGVISRRFIDQGSVATVGSQLILMYNPDSLRLEASISESVLANVQKQPEFLMKLTAFDKPIEAWLEEIEPAADSASRSFTVKFGFDPREDIYVGMFGRVSIPLADKQTLAVPSQAILVRGQLNYIMINEENGIDKRLVRLGKKFKYQDADWVEVLGGLSVGEQVVFSQK